MKNIFVYIQYTLLIYILLFGSQIHIGPLSLRNLLSFFLLAYIVLKQKHVYIDKPVFIYILFLIVYLICNVINGDFFTIDFLRSFLGNHLVSLLTVWVIMILVKGKEQLIRIIKVIFVIYIINIILSIFQFYNSGWAWMLAVALSDHALNHVSNSSAFIDSGESALNRSIVMGITGFVVTNGYFISVFCSVAAYKIFDSKIKNILLGILLLLLALYGAYVTQQRMALLSVLLVIFVFTNLKLKWKSIFFYIVLIFFFIFYLSEMEVDLGRLSSETDNGDRLKLFSSFGSFIESPSLVLFGGLTQYLQHYGGVVQHNVILGSWVIGGILSMLLIVVLLLLTSFDSLKILIRYSKKTNYYPIIFAISCLSFNLYSMTHSMGLHTGEPFFWLSYALMIKSMYLKT